MKRLNDTDKRREIGNILYSAKSCDTGMTRSKTSFGLAIRVMLSRSMYKAITNHNFPIWEDPVSGMLKTIQINAGQKATIVSLREYCEDVYEKGGRIMIVRPDIFKSTRPSPMQETHLRTSWRDREGEEYDKKSIWQLLKMLCRVRKHIPTNDKDHVYCTEGTLEPYKKEPVNWIPDVLNGEAYPTPIHVEHMLRQGRVSFVAGSRDMQHEVMKQRRG